ncbi:TlpA disulfide reductase family protein [uncultured Nocardioides sp.]|uniref:Thiol:disulfide oxidoreductase related to ResA n=1 Tax=uncultured Nocardioides sp. TaxID=198441 RepID=A0A6J4P4Q6_9ACTN|nr:TlpA disulfide reductase family protein [uncultured Nocardioides sp.]CAA9406282.1 MAG: Thiol:disulfide oxidoreductase related to ResA [uncultured Nocardioides sp.]
MTRVATLVVVALLVLSGCTSLAGTGDKGYITGDGRISQVDSAERGDPIALSGEDLDGQPVSLEEMRGEVVVVNVWGSWCGPCQAEAPDLVDATEQTGDEVGYLGINFRDPDPAQAQAFARSNELSFRSVYSPDGRALLPFAGTLNQRSVPATVVLDRTGRVAAAINGEIPSTQTLVDLVEQVAAEDG